MNTAAKLPAEFIAYWKHLIEANPRSLTSAYWSLLGRWEAGYSIPGFGTWREFMAAQFPERRANVACPRGFRPRGWSLRNLSRFEPTKTERLMLRVRRQPLN